MTTVASDLSKDHMETRARHARLSGLSKDHMETRARHAARVSDLVRLARTDTETLGP